MNPFSTVAVVLALGEPVEAAPGPESFSSPPVATEVAPSDPPIGDPLSSPPPPVDTSVAPPVAQPTSVVPPAAAPPPAETSRRGREKRRGEGKVGGFVGFDMRMQEVDYEFALLLGGVAGITILNRLTIGGGGYSMVYHDRTYYGLSDTQQLKMDYGGALIALHAFKNQRVSSGVNWFIGGGRACLDSEVEDECVSDTSIFVSHVEAVANIHLAAFIRLGIAFGYSFVGEAEDWVGPGNWDLSGFVGAFKLELGRF